MNEEFRKLNARLAGHCEKFDDNEYYIEYWKGRGKFYAKNYPPNMDDIKFYRDNLIEIISKLEGIDSIFEFGCGYGKITKLLYEDICKNILATDISEDLLNDAREYLKDYDGIEFEKIDIAISKPINKFNLCTGVIVLNHIPQHLIEQTIENIINSSNKYIVFNEIYGFVDQRYMHSHNLGNIIRKFDNINIISEFIKCNRCFIVLEKVIK